MGNDREKEDEESKEEGAAVGREDEDNKVRSLVEAGGETEAAETDKKAL